MNKITGIIKKHWEEVVDNSFFYRGMSMPDLINSKSGIALSPSRNPFNDIGPLLKEYCKVLYKLIKEGLVFNVVDTYTEPLKNILDWSMRDLSDGGIDFTTNYADAVDYAVSNFQGSQLKHNFKIITETILSCKNQACFRKIDKVKFREMTGEIHFLLVAGKKISHQPIVLKIRRSKAVFENAITRPETLNYGGYDTFRRKVRQKAKSCYPGNKVTVFLHKQPNVFCIRLNKVLYHSDIDEIVKL